MELTADHYSREGITDDDLALCPDLADGYTHTETRSLPSSRVSPR